MNQWPIRTVPAGTGEPLLPAGLWGWLTEPGLAGDAPLFVAVEDDFGEGAAVAAAAVLPDGRFEVDGWLCDDWDTALLDVRRLGAVRKIRQLLVGASVLSRVPPGTSPTPKAAGAAEARTGLPLLRDLAASGMLAHDETTRELDLAVSQAQVQELTAGLKLTPFAESHLIRALVWAVQAAHKPAPIPAIY